MVPGFTYPELAYAESESLELPFPTASSNLNGTFTIATITPASGYAYYIREIFINMGTVAAVGTRTGRVLVFSTTGLAAAIFDNPVQPGGSGGASWNWSDRFTATSSVGTTGFCPLPGLMILPGMSTLLQCTGSAIGDVFNNIVVTGVRIPNSLPPQPDNNPIPTPLIL